MNDFFIKAPAKINLFLYILGKRPDGYHSILTLFQKISLFDEIHLQWEKGDKNIHLECFGAELSSGRDNLVYKAAERFLEKSSLSLSLKIKLFKNIPIGGGLGGGSSDAATVLKALNNISGNPLSPETLHQIARTLGADVPFFLLDESSAIGSGIGDELRAVDIPPKWYALATPPFGISTKWVYENCLLTKKKHNTILNSTEVLKSALWHNDLEALVLNKYPDIAWIKEEFINLGAEASLLSGSGSSVFGVFSSQQKTQEAVEFLKKSDKNLKVYVAETLK